MLNALPAPILLDIAIIFTALSWGLGLYLVDKRVYFFASLAIGCFVCLLGVQRRELGCACVGSGCRPASLGFVATLVCIKKAPKNGSGLPVNLGDLHRYPHASQYICSLRLPDSSLETTLLS